jgi:hypothetical protein
VLRNKTAPERKATAKYWTGEHKGKEKQEEDRKKKGKEGEKRKQMDNEHQ